MPRRNVTLHDRAIEFRMELDAPLAWTKGKNAMGVERGAGKNLGSLRRPDNRFDMRHVAREYALLEKSRQTLLRRTIAGRVWDRRIEGHIDGAHFAALGIWADLPAQGMGEKLVAVTEAENGCSVFGDHVCEPAGRRLEIRRPLRRLCRQWVVFEQELLKLCFFQLYQNGTYVLLP